MTISVLDLAKGRTARLFRYTELSLETMEEEDDDDVELEESLICKSASQVPLHANILFSSPITDRHLVIHGCNRQEAGSEGTNGYDFAVR